uniref:Secreted protein n=1 Tax=Romanomermis culicivorax TaxID=13658 RepID=A0A915L2G5_ROMCU
MDRFDYRIFILLLVVGSELSTQKSLHTCPVVSSIERNYDGVFAVDQREQGGPVFQGSDEGFENKHHAIRKRKLHVPWVARRCGVGWHRHGKLKLLQVHGHD